MYEEFKQWLLAILFPLTYGGIYIKFPDAMMEDYDYPIADVIYWLYRNAGEANKDYRIYSMFTGFPVAVRILDPEVAIMFKLKFRV